MGTGTEKWHPAYKTDAKSGVNGNQNNVTIFLITSKSKIKLLILSSSNGLDFYSVFSMTE